MVTLPLHHHTPCHQPTQYFFDLILFHISNFIIIFHGIGIEFTLLYVTFEWEKKSKEGEKMRELQLLYEN